MESKSLFSKKALAFLGLMFVGSMAQQIVTEIVQPTTISTEAGTTPT